MSTRFEAAAAFVELQAINKSVVLRDCRMPRLGPRDLNANVGKTGRARTTVVARFEETHRTHRRSTSSGQTSPC